MVHLLFIAALTTVFSAASITSRDDTDDLPQEANETRTAPQRLIEDEASFAHCKATFSDFGVNF